MALKKERLSEIGEITQGLIDGLTELRPGGYTFHESKATWPGLLSAVQNYFLPKQRLDDGPPVITSHANDIGNRESFIDEEIADLHIVLGLGIESR